MSDTPRTDAASFTGSSVEMCATSRQLERELAALRQAKNEDTAEYEKEQRVQLEYSDSLWKELTSETLRATRAEDWKVPHETTIRGLLDDIARVCRDLVEARQQVESLCKQKSWHAITEKPPSEGEYLVGWLQDSGDWTTETAYYDHSVNEWIIDNEDRITHWCEIPEGTALARDGAGKECQIIVSVPKTIAGNVVWVQESCGNELKPNEAKCWVHATLPELAEAQKEGDK